MMATAGPAPSPFRRWNTLRWLVALALLLVTAISVGVIVISQRALLESVAETTVATAASELAESASAQFLIGDALALRLVSRLSAFETWEDIETSALPRDFGTWVQAMPSVVGVAALDARGRPRVTVGAIDYGPDWTRNRLRRHHQEWVVTDLTLLDEGRRQVGISRGLWDERGAFKGVIVIVVSLRRIMEDLALSPGASRLRHTLLIDGDRVLLDHRGEATRSLDGRALPWPDPVALARDGLSGRDITSFSEASLSRDFAYAALQSKDLPLRAVVQLPMGPSRDRWWRIVVTSLAGGGTLSIALVVLMVALGRMERRREAVLRDLSAANQTLVRFADVAAHHLQEPARRMASLAGLIRAAGSPTGDQASDVAGLIAMLEAQAIRQRALVRDVQLYLAAAQATDKQGCADPAALIRGLAERLPAPKGAVTVDVQVAAIPPLPLDTPWLTRCLSQVLDNAVLHGATDRPLSIRVRAEPDGGGTRVLVEDNGAGIPEAYRERVLDVFERLSAHDAGEHTGIGLAIVRRIMSSIGGAAWATETPGGGTTIVLVFPRGGP